VFQAAIRNHAAAVMLVHNHPSGDPTPSPGDVDVTRRLVEAGRIVGIAVVDHVIIAEGGYTSLAEQGLMPP
jgi:DNA repair protein RadC